MPYAAVQDMVDYFGQGELASLTTEEDQRTAGPDVAKIERALVDATDLVDTHLRQRYAVPLSPPIGAIIVRATADIAHLLLASQSATATIADKVRNAYDAALKMLDGIAVGRLSLDGLVTNTGPKTMDRRRQVASWDMSPWGACGWAAW